MKRILLAALLKRALKQAYIPGPAEEQDLERKPWERGTAPLLAPVFVVLEWDDKIKTLNDQPIPRAGEGGGYEAINKIVDAAYDYGIFYRELPGGRRVIDSGSDPEAFKLYVKEQKKFPLRIYLKDAVQPVRR